MGGLEMIPALPNFWPARSCRLAFGQFVGDFFGVEDLAEDFEDAAGVYGDGAVDRFVVVEVADERLDVAVEDQADQLAVLVDGGRATVSADDVVGRDEVVG